MKIRTWSTHTFGLFRDGLHSLYFKRRSCGRIFQNFTRHHGYMFLVDNLKNKIPTSLLTTNITKLRNHNWHDGHWKWKISTNTATFQYNFNNNHLIETWTCSFPLMQIELQVYSLQYTVLNGISRDHERPQPITKLTAVWTSVKVGLCSGLSPAIRLKRVLCMMWVQYLWPVVFAARSKETLLRSASLL